MSDLRPKIEYPAEWEYRVIGADEAALRIVITRVMGDKSHRIAGVRRSSAGRWSSVHVELVVEDESERDRLYQELVADPAVRRVM